jgi:hypothetical protein
LKTLLVLALALPITLFARPSSYTELLDFVQEAPDQGESATCLFVGSTGAMELIANKRAGVRKPKPFGPYDLAESFLIHAPQVDARGRSFLEIPVLKFNAGFGIHITQWPYEAWSGQQESRQPWNSRSWQQLPRVALPQVETIRLFQFGNRWSTNVLSSQHIEEIKEALWRHRSPVLVNYNDDGYWHVVVIVGYDDELPGTCYGVPSKQCSESGGSFFVRDSFGIPLEVRAYDWFRVMGNAAVVVREKL